MLHIIFSNNFEILFSNRLTFSPICVGSGLTNISVVSGFVGVLEIVSVLIRPFSLGLRLTANMVGGHLIVEMLLEVYLMLTLMLIYVPGIESIVYFGLYLIPLACIYFYEVAVCFIQSYVFILCFLFTCESPWICQEAIKCFSMN